MVNYSIVMRSNPMDADAAKKAYASAQYSEVMDINRFAEHIASHGCVYKRADIVAILTMAVDCMREQLLGGQKILLLVTKAIGAEICQLRNMQMIYVSPNLRVCLSYIQLLQR